MHKIIAPDDDSGRPAAVAAFPRLAGLRRGFMSGPSAYTQLESLLLFQALRYEGVEVNSFTRISDQLKSIPLIRNDPSYDVARLSPEALRGLYLGLLKEEAKLDLERQSHGSAANASNTNNNDNSTTSSPQKSNGNQDSTSDAADAANVQSSRKRKAASPDLPTVQEAAQHSHLIPQLVFRLYARYREHVIRDLREQEKQYAIGLREITDIQEGHFDGTLAAQAKNVDASSDSSQVAGQTLAPPTANGVNAKPGAPSVVISPAPTQNSTIASKPPVDAGTTGAAGDGTSVSQTATAQQRPLAAGAVKPSPGSLAQQTQPVPNRNIMPSPDPSRQPPANAQGPQNVTSGVQTQQPLSRLPPAQRPVAPSPSQSSPPLAPQPPAGQQADPRKMGYPVASPVQYPPGQHLPPGYPDPRMQYPQQSPSGQPPTHGHPPGGYMLPPFQVAPPGQPAQAQAGVLRPAPTIHYSEQSVSKLPPPNQRILQRPSGQAPSTPATAPRPSSHSRLSNVPDIATPSRSAPRPLWKTDVRPYSNSKPTLQTRPEVEPLSPTIRHRSPVLSTRATRSNEVPSTETSEKLVPVIKARPSRRRANARDKSPHSVTSSAADESTRRSQSAGIAAATTSVAAHDERPESKNGVKAEPSTPGPSLAEDAPIHHTRKIRGTMSSQMAPSTKRKRQETPSASHEDTEMREASLPPRPPPPRSNKVLAQRNFAKVSSALMNDIDSHKHASYFKAPVRDKDAPGYSEIVLQPQTLKGIRAAITAGSRAIAAATSNVDSSDPTAISLELDYADELVPPKAIVNGTQLEKELMRMLANAYMFNPGVDGMAEITREMFVDVQQKINDWRGGTEPAAAGEEEEDLKGGVKRRKP